MKLTQAKIQTYKCFIESCNVDIDNNITCLIGKNESGKTAFLEAIYRLYPVLADPKAAFYQVRDFPRRERSTGTLSVAHYQPMEITFELEDHDKADLETIFGENVLPSNSVRLSKDYSNKMYLNFEADEKAFIRHVTARKFLQIPLSEPVQNIDQLRDVLSNLENRPAPAQKMLDSLTNFDLHQQIHNRLLARMPKFLYFNEFSILPNMFSLEHILSTPVQELSRDEITALSLLELAEIDLENFNHADHESRKILLETASRFITDEVFKYWSQNKDLRLDFDLIFQQLPHTTSPPPYVDIRIWNEKQRVSLKFNERSKGFIWFFSFLVFFYNLIKKDQKIILLLDEPGLGLHAAAQRDLLRFIEERLGANHQVIYATHSPFMVNPQTAHRVRMVEEDNERGSFITTNMNEASSATLMPMHAALGQKLYETLSLGPYTLLVERPSDILYLNILSDFLKSNGRKGLDEAWDMIPIGKIDNIPSFTAMFGLQNKPALLTNVRANEKKTILDMAQQNMLEADKLILVTDFTGSREAEIEDMFQDNFYLELVRQSGFVVPNDQLPQGERILMRIQESNNQTIDPLKPALHLLKQQDTLLQQMDPQTLNRFEQLFTKINQAALSS